ncbi:MAG TPA: imidazole glycerol phosphate synthase subunit HisH [Puia sp.]|jgi:glutamine amidotransferase|nr:imidazole glycerol phosphate synthase subunit HisH [Puia sp.]
MLVIVDYGVGNLHSIQNMFKKAGVTASIGSTYEEIAAADKLLLPGMGAFDNCMEKLDQSGLRPIIEQKALEEKIPVLGICVGLQMFMSGSEEGVLPGLGWIKGATIRFRPEKMQDTQKIPNMGWLEVTPRKDSRLLQKLEDPRFYFAHSYHVRPEEQQDELVTASYGYEFTVGIEKDNLVGVQFHPEKSHRFGMQLLKNFGENY